MQELLRAYQQLTDNEVVAHDSQVALACEIYSMDELKSKRQHYTVHSLRVMQPTLLDTNNDSARQDDAGVSSITKDTDKALSEETVWEVQADPLDSVADFKQILQDHFGTAWDLQDRRLDRYGIYIGWELVKVGKQPPQHHHDDNSFGKDSNQHSNADNNDNTVLSNHFFLDEYDIQPGQVLYAVILRSKD